MPELFKPICAYNFPSSDSNYQTPSEESTALQSCYRDQVSIKSQSYLIKGPTSFRVWLSNMLTKLWRSTYLTRSHSCLLSTFGSFVLLLFTILSFSAPEKLVSIGTVSSSSLFPDGLWLYVLLMTLIQPLGLLFQIGE
uniref:Uncharacterized protein n=1 Tax=Cacopsylla melanoneura TaxID=428564 RepID=A0A8D8T8T2_9HEMI